MYHVVYGVEELQHNQPLKDVTKDFDTLGPERDVAYGSLSSAYAALFELAQHALDTVEQQDSEILMVNLVAGQIWITFKKADLLFGLTLTIVEGE